MAKRLMYFLLTGWLFVSCTKPWYCGEVVGLGYGSELLIYPFDTASNEYIYSDIDSRSLFSRDSLQVLYEGGKPLPFVSFLAEQDPRNSLRRFYAIKASPTFILPEDNDAYDREKTRIIYIKYNHNTADTLKLVFKAYKNKCDKSIWEYLKVYHRNHLIHAVEDDTFADFTLNH